MNAAVEVQLDPEMPPEERRRQLRKVARKIDYWQKSRKRAERSHRKAAIRRLHAKGMRLSQLRKCFDVMRE